MRLSDSWRLPGPISIPVFAQRLKLDRLQHVHIHMAVWGLGAALYGVLPHPAQAQQGPVITPQEAQTAPRIDADQLKKSSAAHVSPDQLGASTAIQRLQSQAQGNADAATQREAAWQWGLLQLHGLHTPLQPSQAQLSFERAYALGNPLAAAGLIWCAMDGCGQRPQPNLAQQWLPTLRKVDPGRAAYLEWMLLKDAEPIDAPLPSTARRENADGRRTKQQLLQQAVQHGDPMARVELGMELAAQNKTEEAAAQFRAAAKQSEAARHNLEVLDNQKNTLRAQPSGNPGQAGGAWQTFKQARVYHRGEGVPVNYTEAIRLYKRASDMGNEPAKRMLALIYSRPVAGGGIDIAWMQQLAYVDVTQEGVTPMNAPTAPASLTRDPTPLYNYIAPRWRK